MCVYFSNRISLFLSLHPSRPHPCHTLRYLYLPPTSSSFILTINRTFPPRVLFSRHVPGPPHHASLLCFNFGHFNLCACMRAFCLTCRSHRPWCWLLRTLPCSIHPSTRPLSHDATRGCSGLRAESRHHQGELGWQHSAQEPEDHRQSLLHRPLEDQHSCQHQSEGEPFSLCFSSVQEVHFCS